MLDFACCVDKTIVDGSGGDLHLLTFSDSLDSFNDTANTLNCDYTEPTQLFKAIEDEDWKGVLLFLSTGKWDYSPLTSSFKHMQAPGPELQARTWVTCTGKKGEVQWRQLPIHAAVSYLAPLPVIQKLTEIYHDGLRSADDTGNLPLHLAFGFGSPDQVVAYLIKEFPQALAIRGLQQRRPVDCCNLGNNKARGEIIRACQDYTKATMLKDWDQHWKRSLIDATSKVGLQDEYFTGNQTLEDVFHDFMKTKLELEKTKELARNRPTMIITKTEPMPPKASRSLGKAPSGMSGIFSFKSKGGSKKHRLLRSIKTSGSAAPVAPEEKDVCHL